MNATLVYLLIGSLLIFGYKTENCGECPQDCRFGYAPYRDGARCICICAPSPCDNKRCPSGTSCQVKYDDKFIADCVQNNKPGSCPSIAYLKTINVNLFLADCLVDGHCAGDLKCCPSPLEYANVCINRV